MKRMVGGWLPSLLLICALGCLSLETKKTVEERRTAAEDAKIRLAAIANVEDPAYEEAKAAVQLAEAQLAQAKAEAVQERVQNGLKYVDTGVSMVKPFAALHPLLGAGVAALTMIINALRRKEEAHG